MTFTGISRSQYRQHPKALLTYAIYPSIWGDMLGVTESRDLRALSFLKGDRIEQRLEEILKGLHRADTEPQQIAPTNLDRLQLAPVGTEFQLSVWKALISIPGGETRSYQQIAEAIGRPQSVRAVANAIGRNPIIWKIPCHRVIASDGSLGGFSCGLEYKVRMLKTEGREFELAA